MHAGCEHENLQHTAATACDCAAGLVRLVLACAREAVVVSMAEIGAARDEACHHVRGTVPVRWHMQAERDENRDAGVRASERVATVAATVSNLPYNRRDARVSVVYKLV